MSNNVIPLRRHTPPRPTGALADAYQYARMNEPCPNCAAPPREDCRRDDGQIRFFPCVARLHNNNGNPTLDPPRLQPVCDFSEPRRHREEA
jgi:hypothetical protein